jgi:alkylation response protein AidB-like acyl-CoA dehydrogenase
VDTRATAEQAELQRSARQLAGRLGPATVADLDDGARRSKLRAAVRDAGWLELRDDDTDSGAGTPVGGSVEAAIVAEALGAAVADVAFTGPVLARDLLRRAGAEGVGDVVVGMTDALDAPAVHGRGPVFAVDATDGAGVLLLVPGGDGFTLGRVDAGAGEGADLTRSVRELGARTAGVGVPGTRSLDADDILGWTALGLALTSADLVGVMRGVLDVTVAYAADRKQFGVAVGSFQAVQHLLAEARCLLEGSISVAQHAAWAADALPAAEAVEAGRVAKAYCSRAARTVCETSIQVHGGIGNTWECMAHVYLRRALLSVQWFGDDAAQLRALADTRLGAA